MLENSNKEIIEQLERLDSLLEDARVAYNYVETGCAEEYASKIKEVIMTVDDLEGTPLVFEKFPVFPIDYDEVALASQTYEKKKKIFTYILAPTVILVAIYFLSHWDFLNTIASIGTIATIIYFFNFSQSKKIFKQKEKNYNESVEKSEKSFEEFKKAMNVYEKEKANGIAIAEEFSKKYKEAFEKYESLLVEYMEHEKGAREIITEKLKEAETIDFVPSEYYDLVKPIIKMLKSGRADNYKEALNMAIEEKRQAEIEAARRAEEARRTQIMQEQAEAERRRAEEMERHNRQMEAEQQRQNQIMLEEQRKQAEDARKQAANAQWQAERSAAEAKSLGSQRCRSCANYTKCPSNVKNNGGGINCGGYRPR